MDTGVGGILRVLQLRQGQVRGNDQRFPAVVAAVDDRSLLSNQAAHF